jgi:hypothetical protein
MYRENVKNSKVKSVPTIPPLPYCGYLKGELHLSTKFIYITIFLVSGFG